MNSDRSIITQVVEKMNELPSELQQEVLSFIKELNVTPSREPQDAWDVLETLTGTVEAPEDWSEQHDHYLYGVPKKSNSSS